MNTEEFFPPTEEELQDMITTIKKQLEECDDNDEGDRLLLELSKRERQLKKTILKNNTL